MHAWSEVTKIGKDLVSTSGIEQETSSRTVSCVRMSCSQHRTLSLQQRLQIGCLTTLCQQKQYNNKTQANEEWPWISVIERLTCRLVWTGGATSNFQCFFVPRDSPMTCKYEQVSLKALMVCQRSSQTRVLFGICVTGSVHSIIPYGSYRPLYIYIYRYRVQVAPKATTRPTIID